MVLPRNSCITHCRDRLALPFGSPFRPGTCVKTKDVSSEHCQPLSRDGPDVPASAGDDALGCPAVHAPAQFARLDIAYPSQPLSVEDEHVVFRCGDEVDARLGSGQREKVLRGKERHESHG